MEITADHCTFAGKESVFYLYDVPVETRDDRAYLWPVVADPILIQTKDCAFVNPFVDKESKAGMALLAYAGAATTGAVCSAGRAKGTCTISDFTPMPCP